MRERNPGKKHTFLFHWPRLNFGLELEQNTQPICHFTERCKVTRPLTAQQQNEVVKVSRVFSDIYSMSMLKESTEYCIYID